MANEEIQSLEIVKKEALKLKDKYSLRAERERDRVNAAYITIAGEKCYTEKDIMDMYECDFFISSQADKYLDKLEAKKKQAGLTNYQTKSERVCKILDNFIYNLSAEIQAINQKMSGGDQGGVL